MTPKPNEQEANAALPMVAGKAKAKRRSSSPQAHEIAPEELATVAGAKSLMNDIARLKDEAASQDNFRDLFHARDADVRAMRVASQKRVSGEIVYGICFFGAGILLKDGLTDWNTGAGRLRAVLGVVFLIGGIVAKAVLR